MTDFTAIDRAHAAMTAAPDDAGARLRFYHQLADTELFLLLEHEAEGDKISPQVFDLSDNSYVLVFDTEARLSQFTATTSAYAALSGRMIAALLIGQNIGLGLNLDTAPSSILIPPEGLSWLTETLQHAPEKSEAKVQSFGEISTIEPGLLAALAPAIARMGAHASAAYLAAVAYENGHTGALLGFIETSEIARDALAKTISEALTFSGFETAALDVGFFAPDEPIVAQLARYGHGFDLPKPEQPKAAPLRAAPGSDPENPPIL